MAGGKTIGLGAGTLVACVVGCLLAAPAGAHTLSAASRTDSTRHEARVLAREIAAPWPDRQYRNGRFKDEVGGYSSYGEAVLGYSLISEGIRDHNKRMIATGLKGLRWATDRYSSSGGAVSVFQNMAVGFAYRLAERRLRNDSRWQKLRPQIESYIRRQPLVRLRSDNPSFANHLLVECLTVFNYVRSGITSSDSGAVVGPARDSHYDWARRFIVSGVPHIFARAVRPSNGDNTLLLSDPPDKPLTYQGLSIGLYARALEMLGPDASVGSYFTLRRALDRIRDVYLGGPGGIWVVPGLRYNQDIGRVAVDHGGYAPYGGLALMFLNALADTEAPNRAKGDEDRIFSDSNGTAILGRGPSLMAMARVGPVWMAVHSGPSVERATDVRYDGGLLDLKLRRQNGSWKDLIPTRPRLPVKGADSAGPLIIRNRQGTAVFSGDHIRPGGAKGLRMVGGYRRLRGRPGVSRSADELFRPLRCGVRVSFSVRKDDVVEYSVYLDDNGHALKTRDRVTSMGTVVDASPEPHKIAIERGYRSASYPEVLRARIRWHSHRKQRMRVRICSST